jgi:hypothetical protein
VSPIIKVPPTSRGWKCCCDTLRLAQFNRITSIKLISKPTSRAKLQSAGKDAELSPRFSSNFCHKPATCHLGAVCRSLHNHAPVNVGRSKLHAEIRCQNRASGIPKKLKVSTATRYLLHKSAHHQIRAEKKCPWV